jgi:hypothetical protein
MHMNTIDIDAYCTCSQDELTSLLDRYFLFSLVVLVPGRYPCDAGAFPSEFNEAKWRIAQHPS